MKKLFLSLILSALAWVAFPQGSPQAINYQAVARDLTGEPVSNRPIAVQFSIRTGNANGAVVYREEHFTTTNLLGLFHAQIGRGIVVSGDFSTINWGAQPHFISIELDYNGGGAYQLLGAYELISVPYALYAETAGNTGNDLDEQQLSYANDTLYLTNGGWVFLPGGSDDQSLVLSNDTLYITNGGGYVYLADYIDDADSDPTNEIQNLSLTGNILIVTNNASATQIDLAPYLDNTDAQQLSFSNDTLYLTNGGSVYLPPATTANAQDLNLSNDTLTITGNNAATDIYLGSYLDNTDNQTLSYDPTTGILSISGPAASTVTITLPSGDDWGTQTAATTGAITGDGSTANPIALAQQGATTGQVLVWNGTAWAPANDAVNDNDSDPANEIQDLNYTTTHILTITGNTGASQIDLSGLLDNTDSQNLSFDPATGDLTISGGTGVTLPISSGGDNWGTQTAATNATLTGNGASSNPLGLAQQGATTGQVLVWNGTSWAPADDAVNDNDANPLNEIQDLNLTGNILTITNNGTPTQIDLSPYLDNTDDQTLSYDPLTGVLTISGASGSSVNLPLVTGDDWGTQTAATTGAISGDGTSANPIALGQQGATTGQVLVWNGTTWAPAADQVNDADSDPTNEIQNLSLSNDSILISNGVGVDLSSFLDNTDDQILTYDPLTGLLIISGPSGSSVTLPTPDDWGTQVVVPIYPLSGQGTTALPLSLAPGTVIDQIWKWNGGAWVLAADMVNDADSNPTNEIQDLSYNAATQTLTITNNAGASNVDLSALLDNTDSQTLSYDPLLNELSISGGNVIPLPTPAGDDWGAQTAATQGPIIGDGTAGSPIALGQQGASTGQVLVWNGSTWAPATDQVDDADNDPANEIQTLTYDLATGNLTISGTGGNTVTLPIPTGDNWGTQTAATTGAITGNGTAFSPINLAPGSAANQVWRWNGATWVLVVENDLDPNNEIQTLSFDPLTQDLTLTGQLVPVDLSTLMDNWGTQTAATSGLITGTGVAMDAIRLADGSAAGQVMKWNGAAWVLATDEVNDLDFNPTNEIQDLNLTGNTLTITNNAGATPIDLSSYVDIDNQTLSYNPANGVLGISGLPASTVTLVDSTMAPLIGNGTTTSPIAIDDGNADGDILEWDAVNSTWQIVPNPAGGGTLDDAYRFDIPNFSQQIVADQGPVIIRESNPPSTNSGLIVTSNSNTNNTFLNLSQGNLMYFNSANGAFRAGRMVTASLWNTGNVGLRSFAINEDTDAGGTNSFAAGWETEASGNQSVTFGRSTHASGTNSFSIGESTLASAANSFAMGFSTHASQQNAAAFGISTLASGQNSFASGFATTASGQSAAAFGAGNFAIGQSSFSAGADNYSRLIYSVTLGQGLITKGQAGIALGHFNDTSSFLSDQIGFGTQTWPVLMVGNGTANNARNNAMVVLRNGNVGIDTDQPAERLEVNGNIRMPLTAGTTVGTLYMNNSPFLHASGSQQNSFIGIGAGNHATITGSGNTGIGFAALLSMIAGTSNTAIGIYALQNLSGGNSNIGIGLGAGNLRTNAFQMIAIGDYALEGGGLINGSIGIGTNALNGSSADWNIAIGYNAGYNALIPLSQPSNTFVGSSTSYSLGTVSNSTALGNGATVTQSNMIRLGNGTVGLIEAQVVLTTVSDRKFKTNIQNSELGLEFVMRLRPVTYNMVEGHEGILYSGLIAQELEQVVDDMGVEFSGLKRPANESDHYGVSYATLTIPLIKAVQEQQAEIDALRAENAELRRQVDYIMTVIEGKN